MLTQNLSQYIQKRVCLKGLVIIMDIRHPLKDLDIQMIEWAAFSQLYVHILLTKSDKLKRGPMLSTLQTVSKALEVYGDNVTIQVFSAVKKNGVDEAREKLDEWFEAD